MKKLMKIFGAILFASIILTSCGGGSNEESINNSFNYDEDVDDNENTKKEVCGDCNGTGIIEEHVCGICTHNDDCEKVRSGGFKNYYDGQGCVRCETCFGTGVVSERNCLRCSGTGEVDVVDEADKVVL